MEVLKKDESEKKKVFFITSNQTKLDQYIRYEIPRNKGVDNLKSGYQNAEWTEKKIYKREDFSIYINSFEIIPEKLNLEDKEAKTRKYKINVEHKYNRCTFPSNIFFRANKNNFIYNLEFQEYNGLYKDYEPPS